MVSLEYDSIDYIIISLADKYVYYGEYSGSNGHAIRIMGSDGSVDVSIKFSNIKL